MKRLQTWLFVLVVALAGQVCAAKGGAPANYTCTVVDEQGLLVAGAAVECYQDSSAERACTAQDLALEGARHDRQSRRLNCGRPWRESHRGGKKGGSGSRLENHHFRPR